MTNSKRNMLKAVVLGGIVSQAPNNWIKPVVQTTVLPAHAATTFCTGNFSETQGYDLTPTDIPSGVPNQVYTYILNGASPCGDGTVTVSNLAGDVEIANSEQWIVWLGPVNTGLNLGMTNNAAAQCTTAPNTVFSVTKEQLDDAVSGDSITINCVNGGSIARVCETNTMDVTLAFPTNTNFS